MVRVSRSSPPTLADFCAKPPADTYFLSGFQFLNHQTGCAGRAGRGRRAPARHARQKLSGWHLFSSPQRGVKRPNPSNLSEPCVLEQNLENDEDGAQASPELDGGVSTRSGPGGDPPFIPSPMSLIPVCKNLPSPHTTVLIYPIRSSSWARLASWVTLP